MRHSTADVTCFRVVLLTQFRIFALSGIPFPRTGRNVLDMGLVSFPSCAGKRV